MRYLYFLQAYVKYRVAESEPAEGGRSRSNGTAPPGSTRVAARIPLHLWPTKVCLKLLAAS